MKNREQKYREFEERTIINNIYVFISYLNQYLKIKSFYDIKNILPTFKEELECYEQITKRSDFDKLLKKTISEYNKRSGARITYKVSELLKKPELIVVDEYALSLKATTYFKEYWDYVLLGYKQKSAYIKCLKYLVNYISNEINDPIIAKYKNIKETMLRYQTEYKNEIRKIETSN